jgi:hypothetical protein
MHEVTNLVHIACLKLPDFPLHKPRESEIKRNGSPQATRIRRSFLYIQVRIQGGGFVRCQILASQARRHEKYRDRTCNDLENYPCEWATTLSILAI